jgi:hypothetical protein
MYGRVAAIPILGTLILGCTSPQGPAEAPSGFEIHVRDASTGEPLPSARVILTSTPSHGAIEQVVDDTDNDGIVHIPYPLTDEVRIRVMLIGYRRYDTTLVRSLDDAGPVGVALEQTVIDLGCSLVVQAIAHRQP